MNPFVQQFRAVKDGFTDWTGMTEDLLHVHVGLAIFVLTALVLRRRMRSPVPLAVVAVLAVANEVLDYLSWPDWWRLEPSIWDVVNSIMWPAILFLLARRRGAASDPDRTQFP